RHGSVKRAGVFRLDVFEGVVGEEPEQLVLSVKNFRDVDWPARGSAPIVGTAGGLLIGIANLFGKRMVPGVFGRHDAVVIIFLGKERSALPALLPMLPGRGAVQAVGAGSRDHGDGCAGSLSNRSIEIAGLDLELGDRVSVREIGHAAS